MTRAGAWIAASAVERDAGRIATDAPELWREVRRFNLPVKLALAAAHRVVGALVRPRDARLVALAPCRPGSPELRAISRELDAGFARGSCDKLRVNPIYTLHAIDNLALSALAIRIENRAAAICLGGAAGQAFAALEDALDDIAAGVTEEIVIFGGDQSDASWRGAPGDGDACGVAIAITAQPPAPAVDGAARRVRLVAVERIPLGRADHRQPPEAADHARLDGAGEPARTPPIAAAHALDGSRAVGDVPVPHAARGLAGWLDALAAAPPGLHRYRVPARDGDGIDRIELVAEVG